jgi:hypothetical protein
MSDPNPDDKAQQPAPDAPAAAARKLAKLLANPLEARPAEPAAEPGVPSARLDAPYRATAIAAPAGEPVPPPEVSAGHPGDPTPAGLPAGTTKPADEVPLLDKAPMLDQSPVSPGSTTSSRLDAASGGPPLAAAVEPPGSSDRSVSASPETSATVDLAMAGLAMADLATADLVSAAAPARPAPAEATPDGGEPPLDPDAARLVKRVRHMMVISGLTTVVAVAAVFGVIGYRVFKNADKLAPAPRSLPVPEPAAPHAPVEATLTLPRDARIIYTAVAEGLLVVSLDIGGAVEIRTYDLKTLKPAGRMSFTGVP